MNYDHLVGHGLFDPRGSEHLRNWRFGIEIDALDKTLPSLGGKVFPIDK
jgi:hypothetical protein